jgi:4-hydroxybenzoate polyprenyltransferase and related prenyltransferases
MYNLFKLIRLNNLVMIAITQYLVRFCIIAPILNIKGLSLQMSEFWFAMLVLATVLLAAGGYAINDYFDTKTDAINRPKRVLVGKAFTRQFVIKLHFTLSTIGSLLGIAASIYVGVWHYALIFPLVGGLLWFYSTTYKAQLLIGNIIIALMAAMVPLIVLMFELARITKTILIVIQQNQINLNAITFWVIGFSFFAFITTFIREVVKDMEDFEGDYETGRNTIPVAYGIRNAKIVAALTIILEIAFIYYVYLRYLSVLPSGKLDWLSLMYITITLAIPFAILLFRVIKANKAAHYKLASLLIKIIMLAGVLYTGVFYIVLNKVYQF